MVDLAKIRKKAKKVLERSAGVPPAVSGGVPPPESEGGGETPPQTAGETPAVHSVDKLARFKEQAGKRREIAQVQAEQTPTDQLELLTFTIAGEHYAVDIERIVEIVTPRPVTRIPNADESVVGIISLRGTIVTLVDVRKKLRHPRGTPTPDTRIVVIDFHKETVGFVVDRVLRVVKLSRAGVEPHPVVHTNELEESVRGVFRTGGALTILLDLDKLLDHSHGPDL
ncbi:MAG TPA: chemotaxis protein CheW [Thermoanaerobaculia bacterium]|nr:chemotaxis protein CheW [Thermoanaerobaculia bacterium]